jgi:hypothetical protein
VDVDIGNISRFIDDKNCPFGVTLRPENTVFFSNRAMRPEITQQWVMDAAKGIRPRLK